MSKTDQQAQIFYLDELSDLCKTFVRTTREAPWKKVSSCNKAVAGDRVIIKDIEYIVDEDLSRRRLNKDEKPLWKDWDFPELGYVPEPEKMEITEPVRCFSLKTLASAKL